MFLLTMASVLKCAHGGVVNKANRQDWVRIAESPLLVDDDPLGRSISHCPMATLPTPPCTATVQVDDTSYSTLLRIDGRRICLDRTTGRTNWSQLGITPFSVSAPGQDFVQGGE